jgi:hypothetical protein
MGLTVIRALRAHLVRWRLDFCGSYFADQPGSRLTGRSAALIRAALVGGMAANRYSNNL